MPGIPVYVNSGGVSEPLTINTEALTNVPMPDDMRLSGWVYILSNDYMPDVYKIGMTTNEPELRANQISQGTGIPFPFAVHAAYYSEKPHHHESIIHDLLKQYRISSNREFFHCSLEVIEDAFSGEGLVERGTPLEVIADTYDVICLEKAEPWSLDALLEDIGITVFGCKYAAIKRLVEIAGESITKLNRCGCSLLINKSSATPILSYTTQSMRAHEKKLNEAGVYGPSKPWSF
ncbi:GIY-YIG nuclease family protein [Erwinia sorbitola]|uniref:Bacteriophage T5 Orf172 DNA-binding domain-containing protein n=1 Tax=Erwinia sorbitola TaxID=2681984 RepID=A0A6I6EBE0_9GAMM|nr:GIY-YIG nuclease family protein [Erwinia sorbitola]QGU87054.1 hypothetical protein GN242_07415 [Erwinia sorbitola]